MQAEYKEPLHAYLLPGEALGTLFVHGIFTIASVGRDWSYLPCRGWEALTAAGEGGGRRTAREMVALSFGWMLRDLGRKHVSVTRVPLWASAAGLHSLLLSGVQQPGHGAGSQCCDHWISSVGTVEGSGVQTWLLSLPATHLAVPAGAGTHPSYSSVSVTAGPTWRSAEPHLAQAAVNPPWPMLFFIESDFPSQLKSGNP